MAGENANHLMAFLVLRNHGENQKIIPLDADVTVRENKKIAVNAVITTEKSTFAKAEITIIKVCYLNLKYFPVNWADGKRKFQRQYFFESSANSYN